jgi:hypothetical protein
VALTGAAVGQLGCNDNPGPPAGPGNVIVDDTMQDAYVIPTQDSGAADVAYAPQGIGDGGYDGPVSFDGGGYATMGYIDSSSPMAACSSCTCDQRVAFCLENGESTTVSGSPGANNDCPLAKQTVLSVGCNVLPTACATTPTCECVLNNIQPPLPCYPQCNTTAGYIDVYCQTP